MTDTPDTKESQLSYRKPHALPPRNIIGSLQAVALMMFLPLALKNRILSRPPMPAASLHGISLYRQIMHLHLLPFCSCRPVKQVYKNPSNRWSYPFPCVKVKTQQVTLYLVTLSLFFYLLTSSLQTFFCAKLEAKAAPSSIVPQSSLFQEKLSGSPSANHRFGYSVNFLGNSLHLCLTHNLNKHKEILSRRWAIVL